MNKYLKENKRGLIRYKLKNRSGFDIFLNWIILLGIIITIYTVYFKVDYKWDQFDSNIAKNIFSQFLRFDLVRNDLKIEMVRSLLNTISLAFLSTFTGFVIGIPMGLISAKNIGNNFLGSIIKLITGLMRAVPTIVWVLILVSAYGLSATTAVVGMFFHSLSFFTRSLSETFEEVEVEVIEALTASGSNKIQLIIGAIMPSSITKIISWFGVRLEQDFATAVIIGPAVGVPGTIGTILNNAARIGDIPSLGFGVMLILITASIMEISINLFKNKYILD